METLILLFKPENVTCSVDLGGREGGRVPGKGEKEKEERREMRRGGWT